ncbi:MAG: hypothetical protein OXK76_14790 [Gammaproteobacteria bacterium]|nr:hypothetical protein [Gammaproteobacteria bacterium]
MAAVLSTGCTSLQTSPLSPDALRSGIRAGKLIEPGEDVWITTVDGREHAFKVTALDANSVRGELLGGEPVNVAVADVVGLRTVELEVVPSFLAAAGIYYLAATTLALALLVDDL